MTSKPIALWQPSCPLCRCYMVWPTVDSIDVPLPLRCACGWTGEAMYSLIDEVARQTVRAESAMVWCACGSVFAAGRYEDAVAKMVEHQRRGACK